MSTATAGPTATLALARREATNFKMSAQAGTLPCAAHSGAPASACRSPPSTSLSSGPYLRAGRELATLICKTTKALPPGPTTRHKKPTGTSPRPGGRKSGKIRKERGPARWQSADSGDPPALPRRLAAPRAGRRHGRAARCRPPGATSHYWMPNLSCVSVSEGSRLACINDRPSPSRVSRQSNFTSRPLYTAVTSCHISQLPLASRNHPL
ncbi:hypothetical protein VTI28DRAFT_1377 [Corynascus sepedonium]